MDAQLNIQAVKEAGAMPFVQPILPAVIEQTARQVFESFSEKMKAALNGREERALKLALKGHVTHKSARIYLGALREWRACLPGQPGKELLQLP